MSVIETSNSLTDLRERFKEEHAAVASALTTTLHHAMACGDILAEAKAKLQHGLWLPWLKSCNITARLAQRYMRLARCRAEIEANTTSMSHLGIGGALAMLGVPRGQGHNIDDHLADLAIDASFDHWADLTGPEAWHAAERALHAEAVAAVDKIGDLPMTPALVEFLDKDPDGFVARVKPICAETWGASADEMGLTVDELRQLRAAMDELTDPDEMVSLVLEVTTDREYRPSPSGIAIASRMRDVAVEWLRRAEEVART